MVEATDFRGKIVILQWLQMPLSHENMGTSCPLLLTIRFRRNLSTGDSWTRQAPTTLSVRGFYLCVCFLCADHFLHLHQDPDAASVQAQGRSDEVHRLPIQVFGYSQRPFTDRGIEVFYIPSESSLLSDGNQVGPAWPLSSHSHCLRLTELSLKWNHTPTTPLLLHSNPCHFPHGWERPTRSSRIAGCSSIEKVEKVYSEL